MTNQEMGKFGEDYAASYLRKNGYQILDRNYRFKKYEVDIICKHDDYLVFVEVKARNTSEIGPPWKAVTRVKQRQIIQCAHQYIISKDIDAEVQFDIISIVHNNSGTFLEHLDRAFYAM
ncbi:MAG: YraN family protein [Crocinitomicaceae bacterium]|nr:YraN family protein [Crocinitomicaceae bacterium]